MTKQEELIIELGKVYETFVTQIPANEKHISDNEDFADAIHTLQRILYTQQARKLVPIDNMTLLSPKGKSNWVTNEVDNIKGK